MEPMPNPLMQAVFSVFLVSAMLITFYTCNFYYLALRSGRRRPRPKEGPESTPTVTVQLPIYNEKYVAERLIRSVCQMDYPRDRMCIMVLDDSDDDTVSRVSELVARFRQEGFDIEHVRRGTRTGYKAGALRHAMTRTKTDFVAIFDADFMPEPGFLRRVMPHFSRPDTGFVQCRWGHANENYSAITQAQALSLDFHFLIEQKAKSHSALFMNFNGTAGVWRTKCIVDSGGWHSATLVEDLDLSYRAQMRGWKCTFLPDVVVDAELPVQMNAAKRQQFRWAKGSIQCAIKQLAGIAAKRGIEIETKVQAFIQLTRHIVFPLMLVQFLALPMLLASDINLYVVSFLPAITIAMYLAMGPGAYLLIMRKMYGRSWAQKAKVLPSLMVYSFGMSVNNTVAVFDAVLGKKNEFLRTPKYGITSKSDGWADKAYNLPFTKTTLLEVFFAVYGVLGVFVAIYSNNPVFAPIIGIQAAGYIYVSWLSLAHSRFKTDKSGPSGPKTREQRMADLTYRLAVAGILGIIALGAVFSFIGYSENVYPLEISRGLLAGISASSDPEAILLYIGQIRASVPAEGNPVWIFPTETTSFERMQGDLNSMQASVEEIAAVPRDSSAFHTGMLDVKYRADVLSMNIMDAIPYLYASQLNIMISVMWIAAIIGIFALVSRKKSRMLEDPSGV